MKLVISCIVMILIFIFLVLSLSNIILFPLTLSGIKNRDKSFKNDILEHICSLFLIVLSLFLSNFLSNKFNLLINDLYKASAFMFFIFIGIMAFIIKFNRKS